MPNEAAPESLTPGYFDDVYRANPDPWNFASSSLRIHQVRRHPRRPAERPRYRQRVRGRLLHRRAHGTTRPALRPASWLWTCPSRRSPRPASGARHLPQVRLERRDFARTNFPDGPFDLIVDLGGRLLPGHTRSAAAARTDASRGWQREATSCWFTGHRPSTTTR